MARLQGMHYRRPRTRRSTTIPKLDLAALPAANATGYPPPFDAPVAGRWYRRLAPVAGLTAMGASHVTLKPGAWSSQRHWHEGEDELVVMLAGEALLIEDDARTVIRPGDICAWPAGVANGHHLVNHGECDCVFVAISAGPRTGGGYSDMDMRWTADGRYTTREGVDYPAGRPA